jgi:hypothetical protein
MLDEYLLGEGYGLNQRALEEIERVANEALEYGSMATDAGEANAEVERLGGLIITLLAELMRVKSAARDDYRRMNALIKVANDAD